MATKIEALRAALCALIGPEHVIGEGEALETLSKDFYWYSPVLRRQLEDKRADLIARPGTADEARAVVAACCRARVPVVPRGAGTGNYGQCVPLYGGVVVDLGRLDRILSLEGGVVRAEGGARLGAIESAARAAGWELRCMPSTWVKCTIGGFFCGGSGGIGSITWGGINAGDNVKSVTLLTCEENPRRVRLEEGETLRALHTYGTTGLMLELEMRLAPKVDYDQLIFSSPDWDRLLDWTDAAARRTAWRKRLVTQFEWPIPSYFKPLRRHLRDGEAVTFLLLDRAQSDAARREAAAAGIACLQQRPLPDPPRPPFLTDYTWNHTTLWAMKSDPAFTYLQAGFGPDFRGQFAELARRFPGEILLHLEWTAGNAKMMRGAAAGHRPDAIVVGGIPLVHFRSEDRLGEILRACDELGVFIANPHTFHLEDGGRHPNIADKRALKSEVDPFGLLNPGKMRTFPLNPFSPRPMKKSAIHPPNHPAPRGAYSPAVRVDLGGANLLFVTGQLAIDPAGAVVAPYDATAQTEYVFRLIGSILEEAGMKFSDIVRVQTYLTRMDDFEKFSAVRNRHFPATPPASTLLEVKGLAREGCCVELEVTAIA